MTRGRLIRRATAAATWIVVLCGCTRSGPSMIVAPTPAGWEQSILAERRDKDGLFRSAPDSPIPAGQIASFRGLAYWPPDPQYRFVGGMERQAAPDRFTIVTTTGIERPCERIGRLRFEVDGRRESLHVYRLLDAPDPNAADELFVPFTDTTNGRETYPAGRYVDLAKEGGRYVLDFNRAYNPLCAYGEPERYRCPVPPAENHLDVPIRAGERGWHLAPPVGS